jgi:hypothetical protein
MTNRKLAWLIAAAVGLSAVVVVAQDVPPEIMQPGTQPGEVGQLETPDKCDNCHGGYDPALEMAHLWRGSMMANAGRDPLFWATVAVAEQDFDGAGDLCLRCHSPAGWVGGRSVPTDGSALNQKDADGVQCDLCHAVTNPDDSEHLGVQVPPFLANDEVPAPDTEGYYGSGMYVLWSSSSKLGPYDDAEARHQFEKSLFHRDANFCGTCHDVSNPAVGDLAPNNGAMVPLEPGTFSGILGSPVDGKAAFNNPPYAYGIVERTFSEFIASALDDWPVANFGDLPTDLQDGALLAAYEAAMATGAQGNYADLAPRYFTCQTCHMPARIGPGCDKRGAPIRWDLPLHDMTGGNYWVPDAILHQDSLGQLRLGGGLTDIQVVALNDGKERARAQLELAAALEVTDNTLKVINLTGHKLISGYPEGRRMWLNIKWYDADNALLREDGEYGTVDVTLNGTPLTVETLVDPEGTYLYEAHYGMTKEWGLQLQSLGYPDDFVLSYDRVTGAPTHTLATLVALPQGEYVETFHFVLNNKVAKDNRIPPYGMSYDEAEERNALPVPADQYGNPGAGGTYNYWDEIQLDPPADAAYATIELKYQPTSWEYIQFLYLANDGSEPFLAEEGVNLLNAWLATGMAAPHVMATATWGTAPQPPVDYVYVDTLETWCVTNNGTLISPCGVFQPRDNLGIVARTVDDVVAPVAGCEVQFEILNPDGHPIKSLSGVTDAAGEVVVTWKLPRTLPSGEYTVNVVDVIHADYTFDLDNSPITSVTFVVPP